MSYKILCGIPVIGSIKDVEDHVVSNRDDDIWCDFSLNYDLDDKYFFFEFETLLGFKEEDGCRRWIAQCLSVFTEYMESHNYYTGKELSLYEVFTEGVNVNTHFETIEDAYAFLKLMVYGFKGEGLHYES